MAVFTSIGAAIFGAGTFLATVTAGVLQAAVGIGLSLIGQSLAGQPDRTRAFSTQVNLRSGDDQPRSLNFGWNITGGSLVYANTWGGGNAYMVQVIALGDMPVRSLERVFVDGHPVTLRYDDPHPQFGIPVSQYRKLTSIAPPFLHDHLWIKFYDGTQTTADSYLTGTVSSTERPYNSNRVGRGIPYAIVTARAPQREDGEEKPLFSGYPQFKFETFGLRLYDITRDTTAGGSGPQRWNDPSTWGGDGDFLPAVQAYNVLRGIRYEGQWLYGLQDMTAARLPAANWRAAIARCRQTINTSGSGTEPQYRSGGELSVDTPIADVLDSLMAACQGRISETGGSYKCYVGEPGSAVYAFTDAEVLSTEEQMFTPFLSLSDSVNGVQATWPNPGESWNSKTAKPYLRSDLEVLDGNRRLMARVALDMVPYGGQVQRLQKSAILEAQRARRHTLTLGPEAWRLEPGDIVQWSSERNGYIDKLFRVDGVADKANLDILIDITEVDPSDYDWTPAEDYTPIIDGPLQLVGPQPLVITGWQVYPAIIYDEQGRPRRPSIEVRYDSGMVDVYSVRVQVRPQGGDTFYDAEVPYSSPFAVILNGDFSPDTIYEVRGIYVRESGQESTWSAWLTVTTPDVKLIPGLDFDPYEGVTGFDQLADDLDSYQNWVGQNLRELIEQAEAQATLTGDQELANSLQFDELRRSVSVQLGEVEAAFEEVITVAIIPLQGEVTAIADQLTTLTATVEDVESSVTVRGAAQASPGGGFARYGIEVRSGTEDDWSPAAFYLDTTGGFSRAVFQADQFVVTDGVNLDAPLVFESGELSLNVANIGTVNAGVIQGNNVTINLNTGFFSFG